MSRFEETKVAKKVMSYKKAIEIQDADVDNKVISKSAEIITNSKDLIAYLDEAIRQLVFDIT